MYKKLCRELCNAEMNGMAYMVLDTITSILHAFLLQVWGLLFTISTHEQQHFANLTIALRTQTCIPALLFHLLNQVYWSTDFFPGEIKQNLF